MRRCCASVTAWMLLACSCGACHAGDPSEDPCTMCPVVAGPVRCFIERACPDCTPVYAGCVATCGSGPCEDGSACVINEGELVCSPYCSTMACPPRTQCSVEGGLHATCVAPLGDCSDRVPCLSGNDVCDPGALLCYPANGVCAEDVDCPRFDRAFSATATIACVSGFCGIQPPPLLRLASLQAPLIAPTAPVPGAAFPAPPDVLFEWNAEGNASIALVLRNVPELTLQGSPAGAAIWGITRPSGFVQQARPAVEGFGVEDGQVVGWRALPVDEQLLFLVQLVRGGVLVAASALFPFRIGARWPQPGDPCSEPALPGACANPSIPQACTDGSCRALCASHVDCTPQGGTCGVPRKLEPASGPEDVWFRQCE